MHKERMEELTRIAHENGSSVAVWSGATALTD